VVLGGPDQGGDSFGGFTMRRCGVLLTVCAVVAVQTLAMAPALSERSKRCFGRKPTIVGTQGKDVLRGTPRADVIAGLDGRDRIRGRGGNDRICGDAKLDTLIGGPGRDKIAGNAGPDRLRGGNGNDTLRAGRGFFHYFYPGRGNDRVRGARTLSDSVDYISSRRKVKVNLQAGRAGGSGYDRLSRIEVVYGSRFADRLVGNGHANLLVGRRGDDTILGMANPTSSFGDPTSVLLVDSLVGGPGKDALDGGANLDVSAYDGARRRVVVNLPAGTARGQGRDVLSSIEGIAGTPFADRLTGDGHDNFLAGRAGNDILAGEGGADVVSYLGRRGVRINLTTGRAFGQGADVLTRIEDVFGSRRRDRITGNDAVNRVWALEGNDLVRGLAGNDILRGRAGRDRIDGGADIDACIGEVEINCERNAS
jgi:Ca2+-binding RTX toxin-like protein